MTFLQTLTSGKRLVFDGAMGTMLQRMGLLPGQNPEEFCLARPDILQSVHEAYVKAGADVITTNTFGGTRLKLPPAIEPVSFNRQMAHAARKAAAAGNRRVFVAGSVGPCGKFLRPLGELAFTDMVEIFREQIRGLQQGGADFILAETQFDIAEARAVVVAARREGSLPVAVSMTYEDGVTLTGSDAAVCVATLANLGVDLIGVNCSAGPEEMAASVAAMLQYSPVPVLVQPNAGLPVLEGGRTIFPLSPGQFAELTAAFAQQGAQAVGGCCGSTPEHINALHTLVSQLSEPQARPQAAGIVVTSRANVVRIGSGQPFCVIGERINPTGKKQLAAELQAGEFTTALRFADEQVLAGTPLIDVNVGAPMVDEAVCLPELLATLAARHATPLAVDSSNMAAIEEALTYYPASALVNSISGEEGRMERLGPVCREYGAPFILLPLQGKKLPVTAAERIRILENLLRKMETLQIPRSLAMVDALALAASSSPEAAKETLHFIRYCTQTLHLPTTCGLSNISFGLPARELLNASFLCLAAGAGLSSCIANPDSVRIGEAVHAVNLFLGLDEGAETFIARYSGWTAEAARAEQSVRPLPGTVNGSHSREPLSVEQAVINGRKEEIVPLIKQALDLGQDPFAVVGERLIPAITEVGKKYERKEYFLPQLIRSAETMQTAFALLEPLLVRDSRAVVRPVIILATVEGDIHDIGKNIVALMLGNHGFEVIDLGKDVPARQIVEAARDNKAAAIGLSALMTTTMVRMQDTVALLQQEGLSLPVMVGGAVVTDEYARSIGAHYAKDAVDAVRVARSLTGDAPESVPERG